MLGVGSPLAVGYALVYVRVVGDLLEAGEMLKDHVEAIQELTQACTVLMGHMSIVEDTNTAMSVS